MGKVESIRFTPSNSSELLDVLACGEPAAFATDSRERVVFWNSGAAALLGRRAEEAMGRHCYEVLGSRDLFGNRFCYANCPLAAMSRAGETPGPFEVRVAPALGGEPSTVHVTVVRLPGPRADLFTLVHILHGVNEQERLAHLLARLTPSASPAAPPAPAAACGPRAVVSPSTSAVFDGGGEPSGPQVLTPREREILVWMAAGLQNKEIAKRLGLSLATVRNHIHNTLEKLAVHSKLEAVSLAYRNGWVPQQSATSAATLRPR